MPKATQSRHKNGIDGRVPSHEDAEVRGAVSHASRRVGHPHTTRRELNSMIRSDLTLSKRVGSNTDVERPSRGVDIDRRLRGPRDRYVSGAAESRFDLHD